jgi:peptidoglycan lytic transglycosylase
MESISRRTVAYLVFLVALLAGCATAAPPSVAQPAEAAAPATEPPRSRIEAAPREPSTSPDAEQAFVDGYRAYQGRDYARAEARLGHAATNFPALADYALYYLGSAQRDAGDLNSAAATFERIEANYPQSVLVPRAELERARALVKLGRNADAAAVAARLVTRGPEPEIEQQARLTEAQAELALGDAHAAYRQAMELRDKYPRAASDADARALAYSILRATPAVADTTTLAYHKSEAELLLREGQAPLALQQAELALQLPPLVEERAALLWIEARALRSQPILAKRALLNYLKIAPKGPAAPAALEMLGLMYWRENDTAHARATFARIATGFPASQHAPGAMLRIGRIFEEEGKYDSARAEYRRLAARYPSSEPGAEARFRAPWTYYMTRQYKSAAAGFKMARTRGASERDMYDYWRARALDRIGEHDTARTLYLRVASSIESNYYPALATRRVAITAPDLPAARASDPSAFPVPAVTGRAEFHLRRALTLRALGLKELEPAELRALEPAAETDPDLRSFVLAGFQASGAWYDAIVAATRMEKRGHLSREVAERVRYPRAWWDLLQRACAKRGLDPYLVLALARQESLFNPRATSVSDAQGLMQLLPSTARKIARESGTGGAQLDLYDPALNVELGTTYLGNLFEMFRGDEFKAVAAYNGGEHAVEQWTRKFPGDDDEWVENIGYRETREYVKKVIGGRREYLLLYRRESSASSSRPMRQSRG